MNNAKYQMLFPSPILSVDLPLIKNDVIIYFPLILNLIWLNDEIKYITDSQYREIQNAIIF